MEKFVVERNNDKNIEFVGEMIIEVVSSPDMIRGLHFSGSIGRWQKLRLYRTEGGKFVCQRINLTQWECERPKLEAAICEDHEQVSEFFGSGWLAKDLYKEAGIDYKILVD